MSNPERGADLDLERGQKNPDRGKDLDSRPQKGRGARECERVPLRSAEPAIVMRYARPSEVGIIITISTISEVD